MRTPNRPESPSPRRASNWATVSITCLAALMVATLAPAQQANDSEYTRRILEYTTEPFFLTEYVDHLPASSTVPTPLEVLGTIAGAPEVLHYSGEVHRYMRAVAAASPRVEVLPMGTSDEGRERILVVISSEDTINNLERHKAMTARLADPRTISDTEAAALIAETKPIYMATGGQHSPETGSPEMLMELVYRLAVEESDFIRDIRDNMILLLVPVMEVDGRDKQVDIHMARHQDPDADLPSRLLYWGQYVAHDNNRDGLGIQLEMTRSAFDVILDWHPQVFHDLHESASYLYASTGTGPYNPWIDPIQVDEWHMLAYTEINELTKRGVPGVYTHGYWDGWGIAGLNTVVNVHNGIGRFYEVQGARNASNYVVRADPSRSWYKPNPPLRETVFSIRNHVNLSQSALLIATNYMANNRQKFMENFYLKSKRSVQKAHTEGPAAYVLPASDPRPGQQAQLINGLRRQGVEVHRTAAAFRAGGRSFEPGSYVVRMDQPYSRAADILLDTQYYNPDEQRPSDDVGWTFGPLFNVETVRIEDPDILDIDMDRAAADVVPAGGVAAIGSQPSSATPQPVAYAINQNADSSLAAFRLVNIDLRVAAAETAFEAGGRRFNAGSMIIEVAGNPPGLGSLLESEGSKRGFTAYALAAAPDVSTHALATPRVAVMHTWTTTQTEGWIRLVLDRFEIPYDYISVHDVRDNATLEDSYDVIIFAPAGGDALGVVRGAGGDRPIPWQATELTPNLGRQDATDDMRGGLELEGVTHLRNFVQAGGTFITIGNSASLPVHFGLAPGVSIAETPDLWARGGVFRTRVADPTSPIVYGYDDELGVRFGDGPVLRVGGTPGGGRGGAAPGGGEPAASGDTTTRTSGRGATGERDIPQGRPGDLGRAAVDDFWRLAPPGSETPTGGGPGRGPAPDPRARPRVILRFDPSVDELLISGGLKNGDELAGTPALIDAPLGDGHVVLFSFDPFHRAFSSGSYALVFNTIMNYQNLDDGRGARARGIR